MLLCRRGLGSRTRIFLGIENGQGSIPNENKEYGANNLANSDRPGYSAGHFVR